jgi:hypothetical protein
MIGILGGRSAGRCKRAPRKTRLRPLRPSAGIREQSFALQQVIGRSQPAGQGIVTFFTIFLLFVYCAAPKLSTGVSIFPRTARSDVILNYASQIGKDQLFVSVRTIITRCVQLHVIDE